MEDKLSKPAEVAEIMRISKSITHALLKAGVLPEIRIWKMVRIM